MYVGVRKERREADAPAPRPEMRESKSSLIYSPIVALGMKATTRDTGLESRRSRRREGASAKKRKTENSLSLELNYGAKLGSNEILNLLRMTV